MKMQAKGRDGKQWVLVRGVSRGGGGGEEGEVGESGEEEGGRRRGGCFHLT